MFLLRSLVLLTLQYLSLVLHEFSEGICGDVDMSRV